VFPSLGGFGPFFTTFVYNERLVFYTFKVCYVWSSPDVAAGEPQYAELIEMQMVPCVPATQGAVPGLELRLAEKSTQEEWPSLDGEVAEAPKQVKADSQARFRLQWVEDVLPALSSSNKDKAKERKEKHGRVCIEDPRMLAEASGRAVTNRLGRGCCKDGDWEKVSTDQKRASWLYQITESKTLDKLNVHGEVQEGTSVTCKATLHIRKPL
jgi:hypothetical protein